MDGDEAEVSTGEYIKDIVEAKVVLSTDYLRSALYDPSLNTALIAVLPSLLETFSNLLVTTMELRQELELASKTSDLSCLHHPSISEHSQNQHFEDWTILIELVRDSWLQTVQVNREKALHVADSWRFISFPIFRRLLFFIAATSDAISAEKAVRWLVAENCRWLWSIETLRECIRLLVSLVSKANTVTLLELERYILVGPPRDMYREDISEEDWLEVVDKEVWLRLAKMNAAGASLSAEGASRLEALEDVYPDWELSLDESDEFPFWMGESEGDSGEVILIPRRRKEMVAWLLDPDNRSSGYWKTDNWRTQCTTNFHSVATALFELSRSDEWPTERWREALQEWIREPKWVQRSWRYMAQVIIEAPDNIFLELIHTIGSWIKAVAKVIDSQDELFFKFTKQILNIKRDDSLSSIGVDDIVTDSINHPVGHATQALLDWWYRQSPETDEGLDDRVSSLFADISDTNVEIYRYGRVLLSANVISLFRVDEEWSKQYLLPLFDWGHLEVEAKAAWKGFLWSPRLYFPLLKEIKTPLLQTASHYGVLGTHAKQYASFLAFIGLNPTEIFTTNELHQATLLLPIEGLQDTAQTLTRAFEGSKEQVEYWNTRLYPYLKKVWPKSVELRTTQISESFGRLCVAAGEMFPVALDEVGGWLQPLEYPGYLVSKFNNTELCNRFPEEALALLDAIVDDAVQRLPKELGQCLKKIIDSESGLEYDPRYVRLNELFRRRGY